MSDYMKYLELYNKASDQLLRAQWARNQNFIKEDGLKSRHAQFIEEQWVKIVRQLDILLRVVAGDENFILKRWKIHKAWKKISKVKDNQSFVTALIMLEGDLKRRGF
jgi:hypothetical protein